MSQEPTLASVLQGARRRLKSAGFDDDGVEAEALVCHALGVDPSRLYAHPDERLSPQSVQRVEEYLGRRLVHEPLAYITGVAHFYGREFAVDRRVLIPRPETELLVERCLSWVMTQDDSRRATRSGPPVFRIADIGTGSGILAVTLASELADQMEVHAVDASADALDVARANAAKHGVGDRMRFHQGDLGSPLAGRFEIVVANLPYIRTGELEARQPELAFEPRSALDGGDDGMRFIGPLIDDLPRLMSTPGLALLEIDPPIAQASLARARLALPDSRQLIRNDLAGLARVLEVAL